MKTLNVFFAASKMYLQHFTVSATSLLENNKNLEIRIYLLVDQTDMPYFKECIEFFLTAYSVTLTLLDVGNINFSGFRLDTDLSKYTYYRLFLADLAPKEVETALFLDSDVVVTGSLKELAGLDMTGKYVYAVKETSVKDNVDRLNKLGFSLTSYFNAGVILVNIKAWRDEKLSAKFIALADQYSEKLDWVDQDILNMQFLAWSELDAKYNAIHLFRKLPEVPLIIHYNTFSKPWFYVDTHPYNYLYQKYLALTPYKNVKATGFSLKNFILKNGRLIKRALREANLMKYKKATKNT